MPFRNDAVIASLLATAAAGPRVEILNRPNLLLELDPFIDFYSRYGSNTVPAASMTLQSFGPDVENLRIYRDTNPPTLAGGQELSFQYDPARPAGKRRIASLITDHMKMANVGETPYRSGNVPIVPLLPSQTAQPTGPRALFSSNTAETYDLRQPIIQAFYREQNSDVFGNTVVTFPQAFPNGIMSVSCISVRVSGALTGPWSYEVIDSGLAFVTFNVNYNGSGYASQLCKMSIIAIGA